ncbi:MAG: DNA-directed RNA polymerase subunit beta, partial [bacterium]
MVSEVSFKMGNGRKEVMEAYKGTKRIVRIPFGKILPSDDMPDLLEVQFRSFQEFLQKDVPPDKRERKGLQAVFLNIFPILDNREERVLEFVEYYLGPPKYTEEECRERGSTYEAPLKVKLRLSSKEFEDEKTPGHTVEAEVYMGTIPLMTRSGTFIINGAERVIVSQLHRSPGVFFSEALHPNGITKLYSARVIPFRGSWIEFSTDINEALYVYFDRHKNLPVTTLLRALGYSTNNDIWALFGYSTKLSLKSKKVGEYYGWSLTQQIVDTETGELLASEGDRFTPELKRKLLKSGINEVVIKRDGEEDIGWEMITKTLEKDRSTNQQEALYQLFRVLRNAEPQDIDAAKRFLTRLFFDEKRYDLGRVGRYRLNKKLGLNIPETEHTLTRSDIVAIIKRLIDLRAGKEHTDDIDHLGNRRVRTVGEQLTNQFTVALSRLARFIKERLNIRDSERPQPQDLMNVRTVTSVIKSFFGTNPLSQFLDQENPLAELTHKRRLSALGPGGLTRERAGFEVRDVHYTHYGRLCPIETPEGPNIGLISSLCTYARINELGFLETAYRVVKDGKVTDQMVYLDADIEDKEIIAPYNAATNGKIEQQMFKARLRSDYPLVKPQDVKYIDVSPYQILSVAAGLIPFLEHNDANRALMGSNMQRQAVPLLKPEAPRVGTGLEARAAQDSRVLLIADSDLKIVKVSADEIVAEREIREPTLRRKSRIAQKGELFTEQLVRKLQRWGISQVKVEREEEQGKTIPISQLVEIDLEEGWILGSDINHLLASRGEMLSQEMVSRLLEMGVKKVKILTSEEVKKSVPLSSLLEDAHRDQWVIAKPLTVEMFKQEITKDLINQIRKWGVDSMTVIQVESVEVGKIGDINKWKGWKLGEDITDQESRTIENLKKGTPITVSVINALKKFNEKHPEN